MCIRDSRLSVDAALLYGQKRGEIASVGNKATPVKGYKSKFARNYICLLYTSADSVITRFQDLRGISSISNGLGNIYDLMGDVEKARAYYSRSLSSDTMDQVPSYLALSDLYYNESLLDSARYYLALATGPSLNPYTSIDCFYLGYLIEKEAGDTEKALSLLEQYQAKKDSLYDQQKQVDIIDAEKRHDVVTVVQDLSLIHI